MYVLLRNLAITIEIVPERKLHTTTIHVEYELELRFEGRIIDAEHGLHELLLVDVVVLWRHRHHSRWALFVQVLRDNLKKPITQDPRQVHILHLGLVVKLTSRKTSRLMPSWGLSERADKSLKMSLK